MSKTTFHLNDKGEPMPCSSNPIFNRCPYKKEPHFDTELEARKYYASQRSTFDENTTLSKKKRGPLREYFNEEGLTDGMVEFRDELVELGKQINTYRRYRETGLHERPLVPRAPQYLEPYLNKLAMSVAWEKVDVATLRSMYKHAMKSYYMDKKFGPRDVDCLFTDDEIESFLVGDE